MKAIFLDRDGVINPLVYDEEFGTVDSPRNPEQLELFPQAIAGIRLINEAGLPVVVVSNQPGIAKGKLDELLFRQIETKMNNELAAAGCYLNGIYYCLHHPDAVKPRLKVACTCRKPKPGLLIRAARENGFDLKKSFVIGDGLTDVAAGKRVGCRTILIGQEKCDICRKFTEMDLRPDFLASNLYEAARIAIEEVDVGNIYRFGQC